MTGKEALDLLTRRCARRSNPEFRQDCLLEMNRVQSERLEKRPELPWFLITEEAEAFTTVGDPRVHLPADFLREVEEMNLTIVDEDGNETDLGKPGWDETLKEYDETATGKPAVYHIKGNYIILRPIPDAIYTVRYSSYYAKQQQILDSADFTNAWLEHSSTLLIGLTGVVMASQYIKDDKLAQSFAVEARDANIELNTEITAREEANRSRRMG